MSLLSVVMASVLCIPTPGAGAASRYYADAALDPSLPSSPSTAAPLPPERVPTSYDKLPRKQGPMDDWMFSLEGVTHAPLDIGVQTGVEMPIGVRLFAGYGWVPAAFSGLLTGIAAAASGDAQAQAILKHTSYQGQTFRVQAGMRPFRRMGLYGDFGYARLSADGTLDLATSGVPALEGLGGSYRSHTNVDMWLVEVGSQDEYWHRVVVGLAFGVMGTFDAHTTIASVNGAPTSPALGLAAERTDAALKAYGFLPTITLRLGFDLI